MDQVNFVMQENVAELQNTTLSNSSFSIDTEDLTRKYFTVVFRMCLFFLLSVWSIFTGIINIIAYYKIGLRGGVNQNFFILSIADALQGLVALGDTVCYFLEWFEFRFEAISAYSLHGAFQTLYVTALSVSIITTAVIAVVRCCCVTMPFTVHNTLTARRQLVVICVFCGATLAIFSYTLAHIKNEHKSNLLNSEQPRLFTTTTVSDIRESFRSTLYISSFTITSISIVILIRALKKSSRLQRDDADSNTTISSEARSTRNTRVVRGVVLVLVIFSVCCICPTSIAISRLFHLGLRPLGPLGEQFFYVEIVQNFFLYLNTSGNIFVYYFNSPRFKKEVNKMFGKQID